MSTDSQVVPVRVRQRKHGVFYWAWIPIAILVLGFVWILSKEIEASRTVARELAKLRLQGIPVDNSSLRIYYEEHTHREGTNTWLEIGNTVEGVIASETELPLIGSGKKPDANVSFKEWKDGPRVGAFLDEMKPLIERIHEASQCPKPVWYPLQFHGENTLLPHYNMIRDIANLLLLDSVYAMKSSESDRAMQDMRSLLAVSQVWDEDLFLVTQTVQMGLRHQYFSGIGYSLAHDSIWSKEQIIDLQKQIQELERGEETWIHCLQGERSIHLTSIDTPYPASNTTLSNFLLPSGRLRMLEAYQAIEDLGRGGLDNLYRRRFAQTQLDSIFRSSTRLFDGSYLVWGRHFPAVEGFARGLFAEEQHRRLALTALGVKRFRLQEGRWPNNLEELTTVGCQQEDWTIPQNPPFGYKIQSESEIVLWGFDGVRIPSLTEAASSGHVNLDEWEQWWIVHVRQ